MTVGTGAGAADAAGARRRPLRPAAAAGAGRTNAGHARCCARRPRAWSMKSTARVREMASPQAEPLFQILVDNEVELEAQIPSIHVSKLKSGEIARILDCGRRRAGRQGPPGRARDRSEIAARQSAAGGRQRPVAPDRHVRPRHASMPGEVAASPSPATRWTTGSRAPACGWCATAPSRCGGWPSGCCRTTASRSARGSTTARWSSPTPGRSLHDGDKINPKFPEEFDQPEGGDGSQYLGLVDPSAAALDRALGHPAGAWLR